MNETTITDTPQIAYSECYVQPFFTFYNADNMAIMKTFKDKEFDLAIVDKINMILLLIRHSIFISLYQ